MSEGNLTRVEAQRRAEIVHATAYAVELDLTTGAETFRSSTTVTFDCAAPGSSTFVDLIAATVHTIEFNGRALDPAEVHHDGRIHLDALSATNTLTVVADCRYTSDEGMHRNVDPTDGEVYLFTQFEPAHARKVYACFEQPDIKATWQLDVIAPARWEVVSNMPTPSSTPAGVATDGTDESLPAGVSPAPRSSRPT